MRYEAFMGTDEFLYSGESGEVSTKMLKFMEAIMMKMKLVLSK
jgi:hypothetical protein